MDQRDLNIFDYWKIISRQKYIIVAVTLLVTLTTSGLLLVFGPPVEYEATTKVQLAKNAHQDIRADQARSRLHSDTMASHVEMVKSFPVMRLVAEELDLLPKDASPETRETEPYLNTIYGLQEQVRSKQEGSTNILNITATANTGESAARFVNAVAQAYLEDRMSARARRVDDARRFTEAHLARVGKNLDAAEEALRQFREVTGQVFLTEEAKGRLNVITNLEAEYDRVRQEKLEAMNQVQKLENEELLYDFNQGSFYGERIYTSDQTSILFKQNLVLAELLREREVLLIDVTPRHPEIQKLNRRVQSIQFEMVGELESKIEYLQDQAQRLKSQLDQQREEYQGFPAAAIQLSRLEREVRVNANLYTTLRTKQQEMLIDNTSRFEEITILEPARIPQKPTNAADGLMKTMISALLGLFLGMIAAFVRESHGTSIGQSQEIEAYLEVPVLGVVPKFDERALKKLAREQVGEKESEEKVGIFSKLFCLLAPQSTVSETIRAIRSNLQFACAGREIKTILMTNLGFEKGRLSTSSGSATLVNLALLLAEDGKRVLLVDANLRNPVIHERFGLAREPGLTDALVEGTDWTEKVRTATDLMMGPLGIERVLCAPELDFIDVLTAGTISSNPSKILQSARLETLVKSMREQYDYVLFDAAPILSVADSTVLSSKLDGVVLLCQNEGTKKLALQRAKTLLRQARGALLGVVLTNVKPERLSEYPAANFSGELTSHV